MALVKTVRDGQIIYGDSNLLGVTPTASNIATPSEIMKSSAGSGTTKSTGSTTKTGDNANKLYTYKVGGKTYTVKPASNGGFMDAFNQYAADTEASKKLYENQYGANAANLKKTLAQNNTQTNANYDNSARQAYVQYMQRQRALPSQLQALGVNGGATESGLLNLYNNYGSAHAANEQQRNADLTTNKQSYDDAIAKLAQDRTQYLMDIESDLRNQKQTAINNQINEYNNEITRFSSSIAQYPTTEKGYQKYKDWIDRMSKSSDPLKDIKVALIRQQMATQFPDGAPKAEKKSGGGGGSRRRSYGRRSYGGGGSNNNNSGGNNTKKEAAGPSPNAKQHTASASWLVRNIGRTAARKAQKGYRGHAR